MSRAQLNKSLGNSVPVGRATWAEFRQMEPTQSRGKLCRAHNTHNLLRVLPQSSTQHQASKYELLHVTEGKLLHLLIPGGCRMAAAKNHLRVYKESRTHLSSLDVKFGLKFYPAHPYSYLLLHVGRKKIHHQGNKLLNDTQLNT